MDETIFLGEGEIESVCAILPSALQFLCLLSLDGCDVSVGTRCVSLPFDSSVPLSLFFRDSDVHAARFCKERMSYSVKVLLHLMSRHRFRLHPSRTSAFSAACKCGWPCRHSHVFEFRGEETLFSFLSIDSATLHFLETVARCSARVM